MSRAGAGDCLEENKAAPDAQVSRACRCSVRQRIADGRLGAVGVGAGAADGVPPPPEVEVITIAPGNAFILGVADNVMPAALLDRLERVGEMVAQWGAYPIDPARVPQP